MIARFTFAIFEELVRLSSGVLKSISSGVGFRTQKSPCKSAKLPYFTGAFSIGLVINCRYKKSLVPEFGTSDFYGAPWRIRIPDLLVRSQTLYPAELMTHLLSIRDYISQFRPCQEKGPDMYKTISLKSGSLY